MIKVSISGFEKRMIGLEEFYVCYIILIRGKHENTMLGTAVIKSDEFTEEKKMGTLALCFQEVLKKLMDENNWINPTKFLPF